jgi:hypothetical protein
MMRHLVERELYLARNAARAVREWIRQRARSMKRHAFHHSLDEVGEALEDVERRAPPPGPPPPTPPT